MESARNKADALTRVPRKWLAQTKDKEAFAMAASCVEMTDGLRSQVTAIHSRYHFGAPIGRWVRAPWIGSARNSQGCQGRHL